MADKSMMNHSSRGISRGATADIRLLPVGFNGLSESGRLLDDLEDILTRLESAIRGLGVKEIRSLKIHLNRMFTTILKEL